MPTFCAMGGRPVNRDQKTTREMLTALFEQAYEHDSISRGILQATRPNEGRKWNADEDSRRNRKNALSFVKQTDEAVEFLTKRD